jgi:hypothetical protein
MPWRSAASVASSAPSKAAAFEEKVVTDAERVGHRAEHRMSQAWNPTSLGDDDSAARSGVVHDHKRLGGIRESRGSHPGVGRPHIDDRFGGGRLAGVGVCEFGLMALLMSASLGLGFFRLLPCPGNSSMARRAVS